MNGYQYEAVFSNGVGLPVTTAPATLTVDYWPTVISNPSNATVDAGGTASFTASASGNPAPSVAWYEVSFNGGVPVLTPITSGVESSSSNNVTTSTLSFDNVTATMNGMQFAVIFSNVIYQQTVNYGAASSASLTVDYGPTNVSPPSPVTVNSGGDTSFTVSAQGNPGPSVQWYVNQGNGFTPLGAGGVYRNSVTSDTLTITGATTAMNDYQYEAVFSNGIGSPITTAPATLTVDYAPTITGDPANVTVDAGGTATFTAAASGNPTPSVQWEYSINGSPNAPLSDGIFQDATVSGSLSDTLTITDAGAALNGYQFEAVFTNTLSDSPTPPPSTATTTAATLTVDDGPTNVSPPSPITVNAGDNTSFTVSASGNPTPGVQWYVNQGNGFTPLGAGSVYGNSVTSDTLTITCASAAMNGYQYEAVFSNGIGSPITTAPATLTVDYAPTITGDPANVTVDAGGTATFTAAASGNPTPSVQWEYSFDGSPNAPLSDGIFQDATVSGSLSDTLTITDAGAALNGYQFEAVFTNTLSDSPTPPPSTATTTAATLTVDDGPTNVSPPSPIIVNAGDDASFTVSAQSNPAPGVQWYVNQGNGFTLLGDGGVYGTSVNSNTLTITGATAAMNGYQYEAVFSNGVGSPVTTAPATLLVDAPPAISGATANQSLADNATIDPFDNLILTGASNPGEVEDVTVTLAATKGGTAAGFTANGTLTSGTGNGTYANGVFTDDGVTLAQAQADLHALVFTPTDHQVVPGNSVATYFTLQVATFNTLTSPPSQAGTTATDITTSVTTTAVASPTSIAGTISNQSVLDSQTVQPFSAVVLSNPDKPAETHTLTVTLSNAANGTLSNLSGGVYANGVYTLANVTLVTAQAALRGLVFTPTLRQVGLGGTVTTGFTIAVADGTAGTASDSTTSVVASNTLQDVGLVATAGSNVLVYAQDGALIDEFAPFGTTVKSVQVVVADVLNNGSADLVVATGSGGGQVKVYNGATGAVATTIAPYGKTWNKGLFIATGNVLNGNSANQDIVVAPGGSGEPVEIFSSAGTELTSFVPLAKKVPAETYTNGVHLAVGDLNGSGQDQIIVGTTAPVAAYAEVWNYNGSKMALTGQNYSIAGEGIYLATAMFPGASHADLILGTQTVSGPTKAELEVIDGVTGTTVASLPLGSLSVFSNGSSEEVRVAVRDINDDGVPDIIVATGAGSTQQVRVFDLVGGSLVLESTETASQLDLTSGYNGGLFVG